MKNTAEITAQLKKERKHTAVSLIAALVLVLCGVFAFLRFYNSFIDRTLYAERLNQMREVTTQLFAGLEDVIKNQWRLVEEQSRTLESEIPETWEEFYDFLQKQSKLSDLSSIQCNIVAVDANGAYYTQKGRMGLMPEREYLLDDPGRISYVSNSLTTDETRMVFLRRLDAPISIRDGEETITLRYYGISQNMAELNPYFECAAYSGHSSVYVVDNNGLKLFSGSTYGPIQGFNVLTTLQNMEYLHGSDFETTRETLNTTGLAYSNALLEDMEVYYSLYRMDNAAWTLLFLVPSQYVAMNTVELINTTIQLVMIFAVSMIVISVALIFWMLRRQQSAVLAFERRNNEKLEKLNAELEAASMAKTNFLSNMSHDIRTPMNAIVGITRLMDHDKNDPVKMETYIHKVQMSSQHLLSLINDVLDMSKIESSAVVLNVEKVNLAEQIGQIESIIRPQTEEKGQHLSIRVWQLQHEHLLADGVRLRQIFINLLSNAVKYTPSGGGIVLELAEKPCGEPGKARYRIRVTDNGYGMAPEFVERIFEPFTRAEDSTTNKIQGTGLGMAITKNIVDLMGGTIRVESQLGKGSRFTVDLTLDMDGDAQAELPFQKALLITDDAIFRQNALAAFMETNAELVVAATEAEADACLARQDIDVVLLGSHLEGRPLDGNIRRLKEKTGNALLFYCCDYDGQVQLGSLAEQGCVDGVLARPLFLSNLANAIDRVRNGTSVISAPEDASVLKGLRFLCAEDNSLNAEILTAILDMNEASCVIYPNGKQLVDAFAKVKEGDFDAILMDVQMPVMNGLDATRAIRNSENPLGRTIPIIAMTANAFSEDVQSCLNAGMNAHIAKPLDIAAMERTVRSVLNGKFSGGGHLFIGRRQMR